MTNSTSYRSYHLRSDINGDSFNIIGYQPRYWDRILNIIESNWQAYSVHLLLWTFLFFLPALLSLATGADLNIFFTDAGNTSHLVSFILLIGFSYLNYYIIVPRYYAAEKKYIACFALAAVCLSTLVVFQYLTSPAPLHNSFYSYLFTLNYIDVLFVLSMLVSVILHQRLRLAKNEKEITKMKMSVLNAQINPHFLFNSLNWIYLLAIQESGDAPDAIIQLSGLMRYVMKDANTDFVDLKKELGYIKNYLALQQGRLGNTIALNSSIPSYKGSLTIAPLVAMSFIENAFKYGVNPNEDSAINIDISVTGNRFCLQIINNKVSVMNVAGNGMGIENARQRLNFLYPCLHHLEILDDDKIYSVKLSITLS